MGRFVPYAVPEKRAHLTSRKIPVVTRSACIDIERDFSSVKEVGGNNHFPFWPLGFTLIKIQSTAAGPKLKRKKGSCPSRPRPFSGLTPSI